jgi:hypothetical protein
MNQATEQWQSFAGEFERDGTLRDIYVREVQIEHWEKAARFIVRRGYLIKFSGGWTQMTFPADIAELFPPGPENERTTLSIDVSGVLINCHFFAQDEMEFDLDPTDIIDSSRLNAVFEFMSGLANATGKEIVLTPENMPEVAIFRYHPGANRVEYTPFGGW